MSTAAGEVGFTGAFRSALAEELRVHMTRKQVSGRELARRLHVSSQWISQRTRAVVPLDADDMEMVAAALGITVVELITDAAQRVANASAQQGVTRPYEGDSDALIIPFPQVRAWNSAPGGLFDQPAQDQMEQLPAQRTATR